MLNNSIYKIERDYFTVASLICATLSLASFCFVFTAILFGSLGILFAILSKRKDGKLTNEAKIAITFAGFGLVIGVVLFAISLPSAWQTAVSGEYPAWMSQLYEISGTVSENSVSGATP